MSKQCQCVDPDVYEMQGLHCIVPEKNKQNLKFSDMTKSDDAVSEDLLPIIQNGDNAVITLTDLAKSLRKLTDSPCDCEKALEIAQDALCKANTSLSKIDVALIDSKNAFNISNIAYTTIKDYITNITNQITEIKQQIVNFKFKITTTEDDLNTYYTFTSDNNVELGVITVPKLTKKVNTLWAIHFPTTMTVSDNSSTNTLNKMKMVIYNAGDSSYPTTNITGTEVFTPYNGSIETTTIAKVDLGTSGNYSTYESDAKLGKEVYTFTDSISGLNGSIIFRHPKPCYMWFSTVNTEQTINANNYSSSPVQVTGVTKSFTSNLTTDNYIYVAVPLGWTVTTVTAKSNFGSTNYNMSLVTSTSDYNIYVSSAQILNTNGNTVYVSDGSGSIA